MPRRDSRLARMNETRQDYFDRRDSNKKLAFERKVVRKLLKSVGVSPVELRHVAIPQESIFAFAGIPSKYSARILGSGSPRSIDAP